MELTTTVTVDEENSVARVALKGARRVRGLTQQQLADATGIFRHHISEMENHKRPIGKKNARLLAKALDVSYKVFL